MITKETAETLMAELFSDEASSIYVVLDGASVEGLPAKLYELQPESVCLYPDKSEPDIAEVAPYLVRLSPGAAFTEWVIKEGWGQHWGIFAVSDGDSRVVLRHFRGLIKVYGPNQRPLLFRYYDPRVMRLFLPTCNAEELKLVFGPVTRYLLEDENPQRLLRFELDDGELRRGESGLAPDEA